MAEAIALPRGPAAIAVGDVVTDLATGEAGTVIAKSPQTGPVIPDCGDGFSYFVQRGGVVAVLGREAIAPGRPHGRGHPAA